MQTHFEEYVIELLEKHHDRKNFSCGISELDKYFYKQIGQDQRKNFAAPFVLVHKETKDVAGFYTLSTISVEPGELPETTIKKLPRYPFVPCVLLGRLAIDKKHQGKKLGEYLLVDALYRIVNNEIASFAVIVDAKNEQAASFYQRYGFIQFKNSPNQLFLPVKTIEKEITN